MYFVLCPSARHNACLQLAEFQISYCCLAVRHNAAVRLFVNTAVPLRAAHFVLEERQRRSTLRNSGGFWFPRVEMSKPLAPITQRRSATDTANVRICFIGRHSRTTAMEKLKYYIFWVCVCQINWWHSKERSRGKYLVLQEQMMATGRWKLIKK